MIKTVKIFLASMAQITESYKPRLFVETLNINDGSRVSKL
jgi:hypothetical protein